MVSDLPKLFEVRGLRILGVLGAEADGPRCRLCSMLVLQFGRVGQGKNACLCVHGVDDLSRTGSKWWQNPMTDRRLRDVRLPLLAVPWVKWLRSRVGMPATKSRWATDAGGFSSTRDCEDKFGNLRLLSVRKRDKECRPRSFRGSPRRIELPWLAWCAWPWQDWPRVHPTCGQWRPRKTLPVAHGRMP